VIGVALAEAGATVIGLRGIPAILAVPNFAAAAILASVGCQRAPVWQVAVATAAFSRALLIALPLARGLLPVF
jgi:hypothetical protein